jgi:guanylate kinase
MVAADEFAEWAEVHGNLYGTSVKMLNEYRSDGRHLILDIDWQGARKLKERYPDAVYIFIMPPSIEELRRRLNTRNSDAPDVIQRRLLVAADEMRESSWYDYIIVNDSFSAALEKLKAVIIAEQCRTTKVRGSVSGIFGGAISDEW